ncbi:MAG: hypothetical protein MUC28_01725 [Planctomycetes bacterium]|jgi:hypothetical protein|nr:hypothetical protein [Planctomycetota bacterium]
MDINEFLSDKKNRQYLMAAGLVLALGGVLLYFFVFSKNGGDPALTTPADSFTVRVGEIKTLPIEVFENEKFKSLKENKVNWPDENSIKKGNNQPFRNE